MYPPYDPPISTTRFESSSGCFAIQSSSAPMSRTESSRCMPLSSAT